MNYSNITQYKHLPLHKRQYLARFLKQLHIQHLFYHNLAYDNMCYSIEIFTYPASVQAFPACFHFSQTPQGWDYWYNISLTWRVYQNMKFKPLKINIQQQ